MRRVSRPLVSACVLALACTLAAQRAGHSLRFFGNGRGDIDRVKIRIDDPANNLPGPPADVGATDFTIELWIRGSLSDNRASAVGCGSNISWINGNIVLDRDRFNQGRTFGMSLGRGVPAFGVLNGARRARTVCARTNVLDGRWHHVALQRRRSDGWLWIFVDGRIEASADGPDGDMSYPDDGKPGNHCGGPCTWSDPFLVIGAEKHDAGPSYPSFSGYVDELRISHTLRYSVGFTPKAEPFVPDAATAALYHFDEGEGTVASDTSGAAKGPSHGELRVGGNPRGPLWSTATPFGAPCAAIDTPETARAGFPVRLFLRAPCDPGNLYVAVSSFATSPGIPLGNRVLPLAPDLLMVFSLTTPSVFVSFVGKLDRSGRARVTINAPRVLADWTVYTGFVTFRGPSLTIGEVSNATGVWFK